MLEVLEMSLSSSNEDWKRLQKTDFPSEGLLVDMTVLSLVSKSWLANESLPPSVSLKFILSKPQTAILCSTARV